MAAFAIQSHGRWQAWVVDEMERKGVDAGPAVGVSYVVAVRP
jgi:hypothetical protein